MHCTLKYLNQKTACISINFSSFLRRKGPNIVTELTLQLESSCNRGICLHKKMAYSKLKRSNQNRAEVDLFSVLILVKFIRSWYLVSCKTDSLNFNCMVKISVVQWNRVGCQINANSCFSSEYSRKRCICTVQWWKLGENCIIMASLYVCACLCVCMCVCVCDG